MALRWLTVEEMVHVSGPWIAAPSEARSVLQSVPALAGLLPGIEQAHQRLHDTQPPANDPRLMQLQEEAAETDREHDRKIRGTYMLLNALALLADDEEQATAYTALHELLLPEGLSQTQKSYRGEAGAAELLVTRLAKEPEVAQQIEAIAAGSKCLHHHVSHWIMCARKLGEIEDERAKLQSEQLKGGGQALVDARNGWIRAVNALLAVAPLAQLSEVDDRLLFEPLRAAEKRADLRRGRNHGDKAEQAQPAEPPAIIPKPALVVREPVAAAPASAPA